MVASICHFNQSCQPGTDSNPVHPHLDPSRNAVPAFPSPPPLPTDCSRLIAMSEAASHQTIVELEEISFSLSLALCKANQWHLTKARTGFSNSDVLVLFIFALFKSFDGCLSLRRCIGGTRKAKMTQVHGLNHFINKARVNHVEVS